MDAIFTSPVQLHKAVLLGRLPWGDTKCEFCGAPRALFERGSEIENYAYAFIHAENVKTRLGDIFGGVMQFDVIIGNPPCQMKGGAGGTSDSSIYHLFVKQAREPTALSSTEKCSG